MQRHHLVCLIQGSLVDRDKPNSVHASSAEFGAGSTPCRLEKPASRRQDSSAPKAQPKSTTIAPLGTWATQIPTAASMRV
jgi:hypothetical protein